MPADVSRRALCCVKVVKVLWHLDLPWQHEVMTELSDVAIRPATISDAASIARVHIASWRSAYAGIVPDEYLATMDAEQREFTWRRELGRESATVWIAIEAGRTRGFASMGPSRDEDAEPGDLEIYTMYLEPEAWGKGLARELMRTMLANVPPNTAVTLWVLADSGRAQHFYRRHGFALDGVERLDEIGGSMLKSVRYRRG